MFKNKLLIGLAATTSLTLALPNLALADCSGFYLGLQAGYTRADYDLDTFLDKEFTHDEFAGRGYIGFKFNQYLGLETGYVMLASSDLPKDFGDVKTTIWDFLLKVGVPIGDSGVRVDVKGGYAHVGAQFDANDIAESAGLHDVSEWKFRPVGGATLTYNFNKNLAIDGSYMHVFGDPEGSALGTPNTDLALLGISFLFAAS
jgi:hypothetical protein